MKLLLGSVAIGVLASSVALAADLPSRKYQPVAPIILPPAFTWSGFYAGVNAGYGFTSNNNGNGDAGGVYTDQYGYRHAWTASNAHRGGFVGGGQVGYNYQIGSWVVGLEADLNYASIRNRATRSMYINPWTYTVEGSNQVRWYGTVRPRIGVVASDRALLYATGGFAYGEVRSQFTMSPQVNTVLNGGGQSNTRTGWTLGGGIEYAVTDNVTIRGEYAYVDLSRRSNNGRSAVVVNPATPLGAMTAAPMQDRGPRFDVVRVGLNYKF